MQDMSLLCTHKVTLTANTVTQWDNLGLHPEISEQYQMVVM